MQYRGAWLSANVVPTHHRTSHYTHKANMCLQQVFLVRCGVLLSKFVSQDALPICQADADALCSRTFCAIVSHHRRGKREIYIISALASTPLSLTFMDHTTQQQCVKSLSSINNVSLAASGHIKCQMALGVAAAAVSMELSYQCLVFSCLCTFGALQLCPIADKVLYLE